MAAQMKVEKWQVSPATQGDIEVRLSDGGEVERHVVVQHGGDYVWVAVDDVPALVEALQAAANALKAA